MLSDNRPYSKEDLQDVLAKVRNYLSHSPPKTYTVITHKQVKEKYESGAFHEVEMVGWVVSAVYGIPMEAVNEMNANVVARLFATITEESVFEKKPSKKDEGSKKANPFRFIDLD